MLLKEAIICWFLYTQATQAADILYSVILNSPSTDTGIVIKDTVYALKPSSQSNILFQGKAPANAPYSYCKLEKMTAKIIECEHFKRAGISTSSPNEFYGRNWNVKNLSTFKSIDTIPRRFDRQPDNSDLHPVGEIPTIYVQADQSEVDNIHTHYLQDIQIKSNITFISTKSVQVFSDAKFEIGGRSSRRLTKFSYNFKLNKKDKKDKNGLGGYRKLKLRTTVTDPSYMREFLITEMLNAANQPATRASYVRVFINDRPVGLYSMLEKYDKTWLENEFGDSSTGILYEAQGGSHNNRADLSYKGSQPSAYESSAYSVSEESKMGANGLNDLSSFIQFIHDQQQFQKTADDKAISATIPKWEEQLDVEGFLVSMASEFAFGLFDGYLQNTNNYFIYKCPQQNRFVWIMWDFDLSMGSGPVSMKKLAVGDYTSFQGFKTRPLIVALLKVREYRALFEKHLDSIMNELYNPSVAFPVIDSVVDLIGDDVAWDKSLPHVGKGPEYIGPVLSNIINHNSNNQSNNNIGLPSSFSITTAADYVIRLNSKISFDKAVEGPTGHASLYGVKEWIKTKSENYKRKTRYDPIIDLPLKA
ncbi:coth protein-domain-containing protein [Blakeslea trispora]|nr:coth protein-domain-containing protein [Blakeslea trispora]